MSSARPEGVASAEWDPKSAYRKGQDGGAVEGGTAVPGGAW